MDFRAICIDAATRGLPNFHSSFSILDFGFHCCVNCKPVSLFKLFDAIAAAAHMHCTTLVLHRLVPSPEGTDLCTLADLTTMTLGSFDIKSFMRSNAALLLVILLRPSMFFVYMFRECVDNCFIPGMVATDPRYTGALLLQTNSKVLFI